MVVDLTDEETIQKLNEKLSECIIKYTNRRKISIEDFHSMAGLSKKYLYTMQTHSSRKQVPRDIRISTFIKVGRVMGFELDDFLQYLLYEKDKKN